MAQTRRQAALAASNAPSTKRAKTEPVASAKSTTSKTTKTAKSAKTIQVGDGLPDIEVTLQNEDQVNLAERYAKGVLVLFAYPKASTPGCTRQTSGFGAAFDDFKALGATVYGLSADSPKAQTSFKEKTGVDFDLISDPSYELLGPLGAKKTPRGVIRSHWVFVDGKAVLVEHSVKPDDSPEITLAKVRSLDREATEEAPEPNGEGSYAVEKAEPADSNGTETAEVPESNGEGESKTEVESAATASEPATETAEPAATSAESATDANGETAPSTESNGSAGASAGSGDETKVETDFETKEAPASEEATKTQTAETQTAAAN